MYGKNLRLFFYDTQSLKPWVKRIKLRKRSGDDCQRLVWGEVKYADHLRALQEETMTLQELENQRPLAEQQELMYAMGVGIEIIETENYVNF